MTAKRPKIPVLPLVGTLLLAVGLAAAVVTLRMTTDLRARTARRAADLREVQALAARLETSVVLPAKALAGAGAPVPFKDIFLKVMPEGDWARSIETREAGPAGRELVRVTVSLAEADLRKVGTLITSATMDVPPWRLREAKIRAGTTPGNGMATLTFEAPEGRAAGGKAP